MKQHMLGPLLECNPFPTEAKEQLRKIFESHKVYRQQYRPWENVDVDLTFTGSWTPSVRRFADLVERVVYGKDMDVQIKLALKQRKTATDMFLQGGLLKEEWDQILEELSKETAVGATGPGGSGPGTDSTAAPESTASVAADAADAQNQIQQELLAAGASESDVERYKMQAKRLVLAYVQLVSGENMSETQLKDAISNFAAGKAPAAALLYDPKQVGESKTSPHVRMTAFNEVHCQLVVSAFTAARGSCGSVQAGDLVALFDGFRPGLSNKFGRVFVDENSRKVKNHASSLLMVYSQTQLMKRKRACRTSGGMKVEERVHIFSASDKPNKVLPARKRLHFTDCSDSNLVSVVGAVTFQQWSLAWTAQFGIKKLIMGPFWTPVGGATPGVDPDVDEDASDYLIAEMTDDDPGVIEKLPGADQLTVGAGRLAKPIREDTNVEPVFFHAVSVETHEELLHGMCVEALVDSTPGAGTAALAAMRKRVPYFGVCLTDKHRELLQLRLEELCFQEMKREDGPLHEPGLVSLLAGNDPDGKKRGRPVAKGKPRPGKKPRVEGGDGEPKDKDSEESDPE